MKTIATEVLEKGPPHYSQMGQYLYTPLRVSEGKISQPLARRLYVYACDRVVCLGLGLLVRDWKVQVGTMDGSQVMDDRAYYVEWTNPEGLKISVVGILLTRGKPQLDHGLDIQQP